MSLKNAFLFYFITSLFFSASCSQVPPAGSKEAQAYLRSDVSTAESDNDSSMSWSSLRALQIGGLCAVGALILWLVKDNSGEVKADQDKTNSPEKVVISVQKPKSNYLTRFVSRLNNCKMSFANLMKNLAKYTFGGIRISASL